MQQRRFAGYPVIILGIAILVNGCDRSPTPPLERNAQRATLNAIPDVAMGSLSAVAIQIVAGLRDSAVRYNVHDMMLEPANYGIGIDLQDCAPGGRVYALLTAAERQGGQSPEVQCAELRKLRGAVLFMEPSRLKTWNPRVIPIVAAIENPDAVLPQHFLAYRSPDRTIELTPKGNVGGPLLVVLPVPHPSRPRNYTKSKPAIKAVIAPAGAGKGHTIR